jgi:hypothetical protein
MIPERRVSGFVYLYYRPNMNLAAGGAALWDPSGEEIYDCLFYEFNEHLPFPIGADMFDASLQNGLTFEVLELLQSYRMVLKASKGLEFDLTWEGIMEPHEVELGDPNRVDLAEWGARHYEQAGRMRGTVNLEGETLEVDSWSLRDRTWGPREPDRAPRAAWPWAIASEASSFQVAAVSDLPPETNPIAGTTERVMYGWYMKDGVLGHLVSGERRVVERSEDGRPIREVVDATDHLGRVLHAEGVCENWLKWPNYVDWFDWWSLCRWEFDGQSAWGEAHDYYSFRQSRRFQRSLRKQTDVGVSRLGPAR